MRGASNTRRLNAFACPLMTTSSKVDFVSDVICPWCFIGLVRLEKALADAAAAGDAPRTIAFHPFQLDPTTPPEGADLRERLAKKYDMDPESMFARVESVARESGIPLDFSKVRRTPNTLKAHALIGSAASPQQQHAIAKALFHAYFLEGKDIGDRTTLLEIATKHGLDEETTRVVLDDPSALEAVREETRQLSQQGIRGVPFVIFDGKLAVSGAQSVEIFREALNRSK